MLGARAAFLRGGGKAPASAALGKRVLSTAVLLPVFIWVLVWAPAGVFAGVVVFLGAMGQWEFLRMFQRAGIPVLSAVGVVGGAAVTASFALPPMVPLALSLVALGILSAGLAGGGGALRSWEPVVVTLAGVCYVNWLLGHAVELRALAAGVHWILLLVWVTWVGETAAYLVGSTLGRRRLAPSISPKKTVEGRLAQLAISRSPRSPRRCGSARRPCPRSRPSGSASRSASSGRWATWSSPALKRSVGAKDAGQLIPRSRGILRSLDGLLFNTPVLFYYVAYTRGTGT